jgi:Cu/Ag efflux protein CusF
MTRRLIVAMGLCLATAVMLSATQGAPQEKPKTPKQNRVEGTVRAIDQATKTLTVRLRGKTNTVDVVFSDKTNFTFRNKPASLAEVKDGRNVICLGRLNDKNQLIATRIDVRDQQ